MLEDFEQDSCAINLAAITAGKTSRRCKNAVVPGFSLVHDVGLNKE